METALEVVCKVKNGFAFDSECFVTHGGFPLIRIRDLKTNRPGLGFAGPYDEMYVVSKGALLVGMDGEFRCYEWQGPPALLNQRVCELMPDAERLDRDYLRLWIGQQLMQIEEQTAFTTVKHLSSRDIQSLTIRLPELHKQRSLAKSANEQLALAATASTAVTEQLGLADALRDQILREAFYRRPIDTRPSETKADNDWRWHSLPNVARLESGHTPSRRHPEWWGGSVPWLALPDIRKLHGKCACETTEYTNDAGLANSSARLLPVGTVCLSRTASIGFVTILGKPMATSQDFCNWVCNPDQLDADFLMYAFMASQEYLRELGSGAVHKTIYMPTIKSFQICAPAIREQRRIACVLRERLFAAESLQTSLESQLTEIERLPGRILAAAFTAA
jgi:type I restriction enzyme S subunit